MSILCDKFNIIENPTQDLGKEDINPLIDNYLENLLFSDERIIHPDFFLSLSYFEKNKDIEYTQMFSKHLENYLKQKKLSMRNNIKNGNFELNTLIKLIETYSDKIKKVYQISNNIIIRKTASSLLYEQIILENSLSGFLKSELSTIEESKSKYIFSLINKMIEINKENPEKLKEYSSDDSDDEKVKKVKIPKVVDLSAAPKAIAKLASDNKNKDLKIQNIISFNQRKR